MFLINSNLLNLNSYFLAKFILITSSVILLLSETAKIDFIIFLSLFSFLFEILKKYDIVPEDDSYSNMPEILLPKYRIMVL